MRGSSSRRRSRLQGYRAVVTVRAPTLGASTEQVSALSELVGAALGTQQVRTGSAALAARQAGLPYDRDRMRLFDTLIDALRRSAPQNRSVPDATGARYRSLPFYEAYFSNFIEGTVVELSDAVAIVYDGAQIPGRVDDRATTCSARTASSTTPPR